MIFSVPNHKFKLTKFGLKSEIAEFISPPPFSPPAHIVTIDRVIKRLKLHVLIDKISYNKSKSVEFKCFFQAAFKSPFERAYAHHTTLGATPRQKSIRALEIFRVQKLILNATS